MKTTIDIADALLEQAREVAAREGITLKQLVDEGLRKALERRAAGTRFTLRKATSGGNGLQADVAEGSWDRIRDLAYAGRGA